MPVKARSGACALLLGLASWSQADAPHPLPAAFWLYLDKYADNHGHVMDPKDFATLLTLPPPGVNLPTATHPGSAASKEPQP
ncbi:MAG: hypothetical protein HKM02_08535 [Pseudomonadales bacterium]|nr:hypothetical protein [Pseudomonadales bacterium]